MKQIIKILVIDDSPVVFKAIKRVLEPQGYQFVGQAFNGREGLEMIAQHQPDLIFLDISMPVMDGIEAAEILMSKDPSVQVIMMSAMGDEELQNRAKGIGVKVFLTKPFRSEDLIRIARNLL